MPVCMHSAFAARHILNLSARALESRIHASAYALQVWGIAALITAIRYRYERPPSDDWQHLPFILVADAGAKSDDTAMADIASDRMTAILFTVELLGLRVTG